MPCPCYRVVEPSPIGPLRIRSPSTLLVVPTHLMDQWKDEVALFMPGWMDVHYAATSEYWSTHKHGVASPTMHRHAHVVLHAVWTQREWKITHCQYVHGQT